MYRAFSQRLLRITPLQAIAGVAIAGVLALAAAYLLLWVLFATCSQLDRSDLVGIYEAHYELGTVNLVLNEDGTYEQEAIIEEPRGNTPIIRTGEWTWDEPGQRVRLGDCVAVADGFGDVAARIEIQSGCGFPVERRWWFFGQVLLGHRDSALWKVD